MVKNDAKVEKVSNVKSMMTLELFDEMEARGRKSLGFAVGGAPLWLCKAMFKEAKKYYNDLYWPVLVGWYRKAKAYDQLMTGGMPEDVEIEPVKELKVEEKLKDEEVKLFGGNVGNGGK